MKIYVAHSSDFNFDKDLYAPIQESKLSAVHEFILPLQAGSESHSKDLIRSCDLVVAEVSYPSTGTGIELNWADTFGKPIICLYKKGQEYSSSLAFITDAFVEYESPQDMLVQLAQQLKEF